MSSLLCEFYAFVFNSFFHSILIPREENCLHRTFFSPDASKILVDIGFAFFLEMTHPEALCFIEKKVAFLEEKIEKLTTKICYIKANIKMVLEVSFCCGSIWKMIFLLANAVVNDTCRVSGITSEYVVLEPNSVARVLEILKAISIKNGLFGPNYHWR